MSREHCGNENEQCPYFHERGGCFSDLHHTQWPRTDYTSALERTFRDLPENKVQTCRDEHDEIHEGMPPIKPSVEVMRYAIEESGVVLSLIKRKKIGL